MDNFTEIKNLFEEKQNIQWNINKCNKRIGSLRLELNRYENEREKNIQKIEEIKSELLKYKIIKE